ncbi:MAG: ABC transporter permease [Polyangiales bacterium]
MKRRDRLPTIAAVLVGVTVFHLVGLAGLAGALAVLVRTLGASAGATRAVQIGLPSLDLVLGVFSAFVTRSTLATVRGTKGRARVATLGIASALHYVAMAAFWAIAMEALARVIDAGLAEVLAPVDVFLGVDPRISLALQVLGGLGLALAVVMLVAALTTWFLLPESVRAKAFVGLDVVLLLAFLVTTALFPIRPPASAPDDLVGPIVRLATTSVFALRATLRLFPRVLNALELVNVRWLVASRHLRSRKSSFLAAIGALSVLAVALSSCMLTTVLSVMGGFRNDLKQKILGNSAHVVVDRDHGSFEGWSRTLESVRHAPGVVAATPYVEGEVMVTSSSNLNGALLRGIDPSTVSAVTDLRRNLVDGSLDYLEHPERMLDAQAQGPRAIRSRPAAGERTVLPGIVVGKELARSLRLYVGDEIDVISPFGDLGPTGPVPKTRSFRIAGIFYSGMYEYDMKYAYVQLPVAQRFLGLGDAISGIEVRVRDVDRAPEIASALARLVGRRELRVEDWQARNRNLFGALALEKLAMFVTLGIAVVIAGFCVFGTLTLMVQEKSKEVGILKAMGATDRSIVSVFLLEGFLIGLFGAVLGLSLGFVVAFGAEHFGIRLNPEVYYIDRLPVHLDATEFALVGISAVVVCLLSTVFPAVLASRTRPVDALRYD